MADGVQVKVEIGVFVKVGEAVLVNVGDGTLEGVRVAVPVATVSRLMAGVNVAVGISVLVGV